MLLRSCCTLWALLAGTAAAAVFVEKRAADSVLRRWRRANSGFLEELKQGNLERECIEEICDYEEAREVFESDDKTDEFWAIYVDGDACESNPCAHGGQCKDGIGSYTCYCQEGYKGFSCEIVIPQLCESSNGGCEHFCQVVRGNAECSCTDRYFLASDGKSCLSNETFKCGAIFTENIRTVFRYERGNLTGGDAKELMTNTNSTEQLSDPSADDLSSTTNTNPPQDVVVEQVIFSQRAGMTRIVNGEDCPPGECPWQALLLNEDNQGFCGGTILNEYVILTAAHCMNQTRYMYVKLGEFDTLVDDGNEAVHHVAAIVTHFKYKPDTYHNDIALIKLATPIKFTRYILPACIPESDFAEKVLMRQRDGLVSGFGRLGEGRQPSTILQRLTVPYVDRQTCIESTKLRISMRMFCAGYDTIGKDACQGDSGGPHVTRYRDTYFITGIVSWGEGCARNGKYGVYTQVSKYIRWIREGIDSLMPKDKTGSRLKRHRGPIERLYLFYGKSSEDCAVLNGFVSHRRVYVRVCMCAVSVMAVSIMSGSLLAFCLLGCFLQVFGQGAVFRGAPGAHAVFLRSKRANQFLVEEILQGNLERECYEELCSYEEAREVFEDDDQTVAFWTVYYDGNQCEPNPCLNGGNCTDKVGGFSCACRTPHYGPICQLEALEKVLPVPQTTAAEFSECPTEGPTACDQLCTASHRAFSCSCMTGFKLQGDGRSCLPEVKFPCGRLSDATASMCRHGYCPWQVSLLSSEGVELCGGVVLGRRSVLTAASCLALSSGSDLRPSAFYVVAGKNKFPVQALYFHNRFHSDRRENDLVLVQLATPLSFGPALIHLCLPTRDFSENILMDSGRTGIADRRGNGRNRDLIYMALDKCRRQLSVSYPLSNKMFCMRRQNGAQRQQSEPLRNPNGANRRLKVLFEDRNGSSENLNDTLSPNTTSVNLKGSFSTRSQNPSQNGTQNGAENYNMSSNNHVNEPSHAGGRFRSGGAGGSCSSPLTGSPVATVEKGTVYLTGLLMSSTASCDGRVFTKVSRYLNWIRPRLQAAEDHMTPQVSEYPEKR
ncbi:uncharacterized protein [Leuresthes tenuis]|uniref:uncharacterized protein n=1 Tax=Leuresthes tenuis TaxID=355514 RepID=UPI003B513FD5